MATPSGACPVTGYVTEPLVDPEVDHRWTSDGDLDRLRPLVGSLHRWAEIYDRWRHHQLARARPVQAAFGRADLAAIDELRGIHFGQLTAAARRWRNLAVAATRLADSSRESRTTLTVAWRDAAAPGAVRRLEQLQRDAEDCAARCERLGLELEIAIGDTAVPAVRDAVHEVVVRSRGFERPDVWPSPASCARRITELERMHQDGAGGELPADHRAWRAELDSLVVDYDAVIGLFRANLRAARDALAEIYRSAGAAFVALQVPPTPGFAALNDSQPSVPFDAPLPALGPAATWGPGPGPGLGTGLESAEVGPTTTSLASADTSGATSADTSGDTSTDTSADTSGAASGASSGAASADTSGAASGASSMESAGGGGAPGTGVQEAAAVHPDAGSARLGELGDLEGTPAPDQGGARLASVSAEGDGDTAGCGPAAAAGSSMAATGGATGGVGHDDQRHARPRPGRGER